MPSLSHSFLKSLSGEAVKNDDDDVALMEGFPVLQKLDYNCRVVIVVCLLCSELFMKP